MTIMGEFMMAHAQPYGELPTYPPPMVTQDPWPEDYLIFHIIATTKEANEQDLGHGVKGFAHGHLTQFGEMWYRWMRMQWERHLDRVWWHG